MLCTRKKEKKRKITVAIGAEMCCSPVYPACIQVTKAFKLKTKTINVKWIYMKFVRTEERNKETKEKNAKVFSIFIFPFYWSVNNLRKVEKVKVWREL